jgi:LCP family protein required for cell wall assembly
MPNEPQDRPYKLYRSGPRGLKSLLRGDQDGGADSGSAAPVRPGRPETGSGDGSERRVYSSQRFNRPPNWRPPWRKERGDKGPTRPARPRRPITVRRVLKYLVIALVLWVGLSFVLFLISASNQAGSIPASAKAELTGGGNMVFSADTILILGTDQRPRTGLGSKEPGSNYNDAGSRTDTVMLWRVGGGASRRLSIPRDTRVPIPGHGESKINAAYAYGGPALAIKTVEQFTGVKINHLIIVNLANFPKFIDAIGGIDVKTDHVCSKISGGRANGGFTLNLSAGTHHLSGEQALILARTRENSCNPAENDLTREMRQQAILNAIKSQLFSFTTFIHLPWAAWDAPQTLRSDMGGFTLMSLFFGSEIGGSAPVQVLPVTPATDGTSDLIPSAGADRQAIHRLVNG